VALGGSMGGVVGATGGAVAVAGGGAAGVAVAAATGVAVAVEAASPPQAASSGSSMAAPMNRLINRVCMFLMDDYVSSGTVPPAPGAAGRIRADNRHKYRASTSQQAQAAAVPN
jgi:hypothetical protein